MSSSALEELHTSIIDTCKGYEAALADAETPELKSMFASWLALHMAHHEELHAFLVSSGLKAEDDPSVMAKVHEMVISVRSMVSGLQNALSSFADGEEVLLKKYDAALEEQPSQLGMLTRQISEITTKIDELRIEAAS